MEAEIPIEENKNKVIRVRFSISELETITNQAAKTPHKLSTYIRKVVLRRKIKSNIDAQTLIQIKRIGNNLNQITRIINAEKSTINHTEKLILTLSELNVLIKKSVHFLTEISNDN